MSNDITRRDMLKTVGMAAGTLAALNAVAPAAEGERPAGGPQEYSLPALPYAYNALEPHIDEETLKLHHDKHHAGYVNGLNTALGKLDQAAKSGDAAMSKYWMADAAFNGAGHVLHTLYWTNLKPGGSKCEGPIADRIDAEFGDVEKFIAQFAAVANSVPGSGWAVLCYEPLGRRLIITGAQKHEDVHLPGSAPLLILDVWEHAYYLKYQNRRAEYVDAVLKNCLDWPAVNNRLTTASKMGL